MPVAPLFNTPAVPRPPEAGSQEQVRERKHPRDAQGERRRPPRRPLADDEHPPEEQGHIDFRA